MKQYTQSQIMAMANISAPTFWRMRRDGVIPPPDDAKRTPYIWNADNPKLIAFLESRKTKA
ncbi:MAG: hypothetical protein E6Q33_07375 [Neisseriales bacterium]|nr:MAG: hypothetical protein E6Q33_07375 [Neisseriales bacterium]